MSELRQKIANLSDDDIEAIIRGELDSPIRMGYELEFQEIDGVATCDLECDCEAEVDTERMRNYAKECVMENFYIRFLEFLAEDDNRDSTDEILYQLLLDTPDCSKAELINEISARATEDAKICLCQRVRDWLTDEVDFVESDLDEDDFLHVGCNCDDSGRLERRIQLPFGAELKSDGSVTGGEITSTGPCTVAECMKQTAYILNNNDLAIDVGCSYHLHFSITGMKHSYGAHVQTEVMRYLADNRDLMPDSLLQRFDEMKYYLPRIRTDKYTLLNFNSSYSTWEFRLFGNVSNLKDAEACYRLAIRAMRHLYQVLEGQKISLKNELAEALGVDRADLDLYEFFQRRGPLFFNSDSNEACSCAEAVSRLRADRLNSIDTDTNNVA